MEAYDDDIDINVGIELAAHYGLTVGDFVGEVGGAASLKGDFQQERQPVACSCHKGRNVTAAKRGYAGGATVRSQSDRLKLWIFITKDDKNSATVRYKARSAEKFFLQIF